MNQPTLDGYYLLVQDRNRLTIVLVRGKRFKMIGKLGWFQAAEIDGEFHGPVSLPKLLRELRKQTD